MKRIFDNEKDELVVSFNETPELKEAVYQRVLQFFHEQGTYSGESIMQSDGPQLDAPELLSYLADELFKFEVNYE